MVIKCDPVGLSKTYTEGSDPLGPRGAKTTVVIYCGNQVPMEATPGGSVWKNATVSRFTMSEGSDLLELREILCQEM